MRLAIIVDTFPALSETFIANKVMSFASKGHEVVVFCNRSNEKLSNELFSNKQHIKVVRLRKRKVILYSLTHPVVLFRTLKISNNLLQNVYRSFRISIINNFKPDIVHFEFSGIGIDYLFEMEFLKAKKVVSCRGSAEKVKLMIYDDRKQKFRQLLNLVDSIHCVSEDLKETILPYCGNEKKIFINYPSIDSTFFQKENAGKQKKTFTILSVGRLTFQKGYSTGLLAMLSLKRKGIFFKWIIIGSGPCYEEIMFQVNELKLNDSVELAGAKSRNEIKQLMEEVDVFLLPSVYEGIANVVLEAMSMELPVISTRSGGMEEVIVHRENGLLADVYDHEEIAENLVELSESPPLRSALGKAGRRKVVENFDLKIQISKFESEYHSLINQRTVKPEDEIHQESAYDRKVFYGPKAKSQEGKLCIGIIVPQFPSYTETFFISKITELCERGHNVVVFCNKYESDQSLERAYKFRKYRNLKIVKFDFNATISSFIRTIPKYLLFILKNLKASRRSFKSNVYSSLCKHYFRKSDCDIYHFGYSGLAIAYLPILKSLPGKIVVSCRGTAENVKPITEGGRIEKLRQMFMQVDKIHCVSYTMAQMITQYGAPGNKIFVNHSAVNTKYFTRKKAYTANTHINILSIGRLVFQKGFLIGILAIAELKKKFDNFTWTIIGEGPEKEQILFYIHSLGLTHHVKLIGKKIRDEIIKFYEDHDILYSPSICEGIANVVLEGMAMELPVVSSINGGIEEVITHGKNGILCDNYDFTSMAEYLSDLCTDFEKRKRLGKCGRKVIEANFSVKRNIDLFEDEYYNLVQ
jgi:colanic acid/amylovoran biosynthesis glycosyltransferase